MNERLIKKLQKLISEMRQKGISSVQLKLTKEELATIVVALTVQNLEEALLRAGLIE